MIRLKICNPPEMSTYSSQECSFPPHEIALQIWIPERRDLVYSKIKPECSKFGGIWDLLGWLGIEATTKTGHIRALFRPCFNVSIHYFIFPRTCWLAGQTVINHSFCYKTCNVFPCKNRRSLGVRLYRILLSWQVQVHFEFVESRSVDFEY